MKRLAIIGGTGINDFAGLELLREHNPPTQYGDPSRPIQEGQLGSNPVFFLQRHGSPKAIPPHLINYRANLAALKALDVTDIVAINAVGGISDGMQPGRLVFPDQIIDYTWGRAHTVDEDTSHQLMHVDFTEPYDKPLRQGLLSVARGLGIPHEPSAVHGVTQGPRLETAAEVRRMENDGCDIVGMTGMPEAAIARELGLGYAAICMVVNPAAGKGDLPITLEMMREILQREAAVVGAVMSQFALDYYKGS
ncbi:MAG: S-methyl-5'-thioinosine phosphorylase [Halioglobus sp.]